VPVVNARHLRVHLLEGFVAEQLSKKRKKTHLFIDLSISIFVSNLDIFC
jgi:hypothetical protein